MLYGTKTIPSFILFPQNSRTPCQRIQQYSTKSNNVRQDGSLPSFCLAATQTQISFINHEIICKYILPHINYGTSINYVF